MTRPRGDGSASVAVHALALAAVACAAFAAPLRAQVAAEAPERDLPAWMTRWSPLGELGSITRALPAAGTITPPHLLPAPRVGQVWTGGNVAALVWEVDTAFAALRSGFGDERGAFRRPLDAAGAAERRVDGGGWRRVGDRSAAIGVASYGSTLQDPSAIADVSRPYASPRYVLSDTSQSPRRHTQARLEGAAAWRVGAWGLGLGLGYEARNLRSEETGFLRNGRSVQPAATAGVARRFGSTLQLGLAVTRQGGEETTTLSVLSATGLAFPLYGYRNVTPISVVDQPVYRRITRDAARIALTGAGRAGGWHWAAAVGDQRRRDRIASERANDPPRDRWTGAGLEATVAATRALAANRVVLTLEASHRDVRGAGREFGDSTDGVRTDERRAELAGDLRWRTDGGRLRWIATLRGRHETFEVRDALAGLRSQVTGLSTTASLQALRAVNDRLALFGGLSYTRALGTGDIPDPGFYGALYRRVFAPELDIATSELAATAFHAGAQWQTAAGAQLWLSLRSESLGSQQTRREYLPRGSRRGSAVMVGVTLP